MVGAREEILGRDRLPKARPSGAGIEFGLRAKQRRSTANASVEPLRAQFIILIRKRPLSSPLAGHVVLLGRKLPLPFGVTLHDPADCGEPERNTGIAKFCNSHFRDLTPGCCLRAVIGWGPLSS